MNSISRLRPFSHHSRCFICYYSVVNRKYWYLWLVKTCSHFTFCYCHDTSSQVSKKHRHWFLLCTLLISNGSFSLIQLLSSDETWLAQFHIKVWFIFSLTEFFVLSNRIKSHHVTSHVFDVVTVNDIRGGRYWWL